MPEATNTAGVSLDAAAIQKLVTDTVTASVAAAIKPLADNQKILADTMAADVKAKADAEAAAKKPAEVKDALTAEGVAKLVADTMASTLKARDDAAKSTAARDGYIAEKLKDVPATYQAKLGSDPAKWAAEEQAIREGLKADFAAMGATIKDVSAGDAGGGAAADATKLTSGNANLTPGQAAFANGLKLPA